VVWWQTPWSLCKKRLLRCQKVTVVIVANTYCSSPTWQMGWKLKQMLKCFKLPSLVQTQARRHLRHSLVPASSMTVCCSPCYTSITHCFSSLTSSQHPCIVFPILQSIGFRSELLRRPRDLQDKFWCLTCNSPLKSAAILIL